MNRFTIPINASIRVNDILPETMSTPCCPGGSCGMTEVTFKVKSPAKLEGDVITLDIWFGYYRDNGDPVAESDTITGLLEKMKKRAES